jgi:hypothetical protein
MNDMEISVLARELPENGQRNALCALRERGRNISAKESTDE